MEIDLTEEAVPKDWPLPHLSPDCHPPVTFQPLPGSWLGVSFKVELEGMRMRFHRAVRLSQEVGSALSRPTCRPDPDVRRPFSPGQGPQSRSVVVVHVELGASDALYIRGKGGNLKRDIGQRLTCLESGTWIWSTGLPAKEFEFQLLLNDQVLERGQTHVLERGHTIHVAPDFEWPDIPKVCASRTRQPVA